MRLRHPDGQTVHVAHLLRSDRDNDVRRLLRRIDQQGGTPTPAADEPAAENICLSLSLNPAFASDLAGSIGMRRRLQYGLESRHFEVVTLTGSAGHRSWRTWWTHVLDLARVLADLLPEDTTHGSVSTTVPALGEDPWDSAIRELEDLSAGLTEIAWHTGTFVRVACELRPETLLATVDDAVKLLSLADRTRIGVCLNPSHLAATGEAPAQALAKLRRAGLAVVKVRLVEADYEDKTLPTTRATLAALLGGAHPVCDHFEADTSPAFEATRNELAAFALDGAGDRPMPGLGRSSS